MKPTLTQSAVTRIESLTTNQDQVLAKGEIWIGTQFLDHAGMEDTLDNHFRLARRLGQEMVCLPVSENPGQNPGMGYRYFGYDVLIPSLANRTGFLAVVVDGPFQRMVNQRGIMDLLVNWIRKKEETARAYVKEQNIVLELIDRCLEKGVHAVIMADDLSGEAAPLINPLDLDTVCTPFYVQAVSRIHRAGILAFLHSCGNLTRLVPLIKSWNLDGLAAIQLCNNDIQLLNKELGGIFMAGIDGPLLGTDSPSPEELDVLVRTVAILTGQKRLILCSSCGLYSREFWIRIQNIYRYLDRNLPGL